MADEITNSMVQCKLCGLWFHYINFNHLRAYHDGMTTLEYMDMCPGEPLQSAYLIEERVSQIRGVEHPEDLKQLRSRIMTEIRAKRYWSSR